MEYLSWKGERLMLIMSVFAWLLKPSIREILVSVQTMEGQVEPSIKLDPLEELRERCWQSGFPHFFLHRQLGVCFKMCHEICVCSRLANSELGNT